jgi:arylformamidase
MIPNPIAAEADWPRTRLDPDYTARNTTTEAEFTRILAAYKIRSVGAQDLPGTRMDLRFDPHSPETLDLYAAGNAAPVLLFIHGGYWRLLDKDCSAFMAPALATMGIATAVPNYTLAPAASLTEITRQMRAALAYLWQNAADLGIDRHRIVVCGSSAGGHLAAALAMPGWQAAFGVPNTVPHAALPISGLYDLAPIAACFAQDWLSLTAAEVAALSPLRHPAGTAPTHVALAEAETPGFQRQSAAYAAALDAPLLTIPDRNHFDVILDLADPASLLFSALLDLFAQKPRLAPFPGPEIG